MPRLQITRADGSTVFDREFKSKHKHKPILQWPGPCPCECNSGGFCGGCGHAGCGGRR